MGNGRRRNGTVLWLLWGPAQFACFGSFAGELSCSGHSCNEKNTLQYLHHGHRFISMSDFGHLKGYTCPLAWCRMILGELSRLTNLGYSAICTRQVLFLVATLSFPNLEKRFRGNPCEHWALALRRMAAPQQCPFVISIMDLLSESSKNHQFTISDDYKRSLQHNYI